jgi:hypothetical protein
MHIFIYKHIKHVLNSKVSMIFNHIHTYLKEEKSHAFFILLNRTVSINISL